MRVARREVLLGAAKLASMLAVGGLAMNAVTESLGDTRSATECKLKVLITGGHPGDPESGCGGTAARYSDLGHDVVLLYLNRGQGYCHDETDPKACGEVRTREADKACAVLKADTAFAGQFDGRAVVDNAHYDEFRKLFDSKNPDVVLAQWPTDHHRDHRALSSLVLDAWLQSGMKAAFYYYEVAEDTMMFHPTDFVDICSVVSRKRAACYAHASQDPGRWYPLQEQITLFRGAESGYAQAEGFIRHWQSRNNLLP